MVLESLTNGVPTSVHRLTIENPRRPDINSPFDPNIDLRQSDVDKMFETLNKMRLYFNYQEIAAQLAIIFPHKRDDLISTDRNLLRGWGEYLRTSRNIKILYQGQPLPELSVKEETRASWDAEAGVIFNKISMFVEEVFNNYNFEKLVDYKILFPENVTLPPNWQSEYVSILISQQDFKDINVISTAGNLKILASDNLFDDVISKQWASMKSYLNQLRLKGSWRQFTETASNMVILASKQANITANGLEIVMPVQVGRFSLITPPIPEARRF